MRTTPLNPDTQKMKRLLIPFIALTLSSPAQAHSNAELWRQWESQIDSVDARVATAGLKHGVSRQPFYLASQARRRRFRECMETNRSAEFVQAVLACQVEQEVEF